MELQSIRLITFNVYLIPGWFGVKSHQVCVRQDSRAVGIGNFIRSYDLVALQEMWGSNALSVQEPLEATHDMLFKSFSPITGYCSTVIDSLGFYFKQTGGLWCANSKKFKQLYCDKWNFSVSETKSQKGVTGTLLDVSSHWGVGKTLFLLNTHLDPMVNDNKYLQCVEIAQFLRNSVVNIETICGEDFDWSNCAVILCGDFNLDSRQKLYHKILKEVLNGKDLCWELFKDNHKELFTYESTNSLAATDSASIIDHIIAINQCQLDHKTIQFLQSQILTMNIPKQPHNEEYSDHWPITAELMFIQ